MPEIQSDTPMMIQWRGIKEKYKNEVLALCAYNAGMNAVDRWMRENAEFKKSSDAEHIPYPETKEYVKRVRRAKKMYKKLYFN